jgi:AcrR family transcriptional regulator
MTRKHSTRDRIQLAARELFSELGYSRATTRAIAARAGVTEVTLFRHFETKANLFRSLVQEQGLEPLLARLEQSLTGELRADLLMLGGLFFGVMKERGDHVRMMLCEASHFPEIADVMAENPRRMRAFLAGYLARQQDAGLVRPGHAEAMAQAFWGAFFAWGIAGGMLDQALDPPLDDRGLVEAFVDVFAVGLAPTEVAP